MDEWQRILGCRGGLQVDVPSAGVLDFRLSEDDLVFIKDDGREIHLGNHPLLDRGAGVVWTTLPGAILIATEQGRTLYRVSEDMDRPDPVLEFARGAGDRPSLMFIRFVSVADVVLVIYEFGLACIDRAGIARWHVVHGNQSYEFLGADHERAIYEDRDGDRWAYRLVDGSELRSRNGT